MVKILYTEEQLARIARRENNNKRKYLVVDPYQGKHVPVSGTVSLKMFDALAQKVKDAYLTDCTSALLLIGFAETATAIGARLAVTLESLYMQTTREILENAEYLFFTESHSHATEQKLCKNDIDNIIGKIDRIVFVEDEVTTGNTIMKIINIIREKYGTDIKFAVASLLNGMNKESLARYKENDIDIHYLVKTHHEGYTAIAEKYSDNGEYITAERTNFDMQIREIDCGGLNMRRLCESEKITASCTRLMEQIMPDLPKKGRVSVIGTEEFMYPAIFLSAQLEKIGYETYTHSTTRSPITVCSDEDYPLHRRYALSSMYDSERNIFIYDIQKSDAVIVITDSPNVTADGINTLANALKSAGNENIYFYRWY